MDQGGTGYRLNRFGWLFPWAGSILGMSRAPSSWVRPWYKPFTINNHYESVFCTPNQGLHECYLKNHLRVQAGDKGVAARNRKDLRLFHWDVIDLPSRRISKFEQKENRNNKRVSDHTCLRFPSTFCWPSLASSLARGDWLEVLTLQHYQFFSITQTETYF